MSYFNPRSSPSAFLNILDEDTQLPSQLSQQLFTSTNQDPNQTHSSFFQTQFNENSSQKAFLTQLDAEESFLQENYGLFDDIDEHSAVDESFCSSSIETEISQLFPDSHSNDKSFTSACRSSISIGQQIFNSSLITQDFTQHMVRPSFTFSSSSSQLISQATESTSHSPEKVFSHEKIPQDIIDIYNEVKKEFSDCTFVNILVGQLCNDKFPMGAYHSLKLALLMSLVTSHESPMHIMAIGREASNANAIMRKIGELAERFMPITNSTTEGLIIKKNGICEADSLVMASRGVAFIGYWQQLKPKNKVQLLREIETNTLLIQKAQKHIPMESTVWAHWNSSKKIKKDLAALDQFLSVFGIPIMFDDKLYEDEIVLDLLNQLSECPKEKFNGFKISEQDMKTFVSNVRYQEMTFDQDAETMLKKYYSATKTIRKRKKIIKFIAIKSQFFPIRCINNKRSGDAS